MPEAQQSQYSRLFDDGWENHPLDVMTQLADWLEDTDSHRGTRNRAVRGAVPSGYVYLGQFVTHDLSHDKTPLSQAGLIMPNETWNWRTAKLDLEILYGEDPESDSDLYAAGPVFGDLKLGATISSSGPTSDNDLFRDPATGKPQIFDPRNDTSLLLAQLQVLFTKFHGRLLAAVRDGKVEGVSDGDAFEETKRLVTWHYQWIVRNDFLPKLVLPETLRDLVCNGPRLYRPDNDDARIPVEFTLGAFQYGHSAVQFIYNINRNLLTCSQQDTMWLTGVGHFARPGCASDRPCNQLPEKFVLDPARTFGWAPPARSNFSSPLDTLITRGLYTVSEKFSELLNNEPLQNTGLSSMRAHGEQAFKLPEAALRRGAAVGLPSGQTACRLADVDCLSTADLAYSSDLAEFLHHNGLLDSTPLLYYILREAEVLGRPTSHDEPRTRLGPLGSRIVAEVLVGVIEADSDAYVHAEWQPPLIHGDSRGNDVRIDNLTKLALYAHGHNGPLL